MIHAAMVRARDSRRRLLQPTLAVALALAIAGSAIATSAREESRRATRTHASSAAASTSAAAAAAAARTAPTLLYADPVRGSDAGDGSAARPFRTLARGAAAITALCAPRCPLGGVSLLLHGGVYRLGNDTVQLTDVHASRVGSNVGGITVTAVDPVTAPVRLSASVPVALQPLSSAPWRAADPVAAHIPAAVRDQMWVSNLTAAGLPASAVRRDPSQGCNARQLELYLGGSVLTPARWPNDPAQVRRMAALDGADDGRDASSGSGSANDSRGSTASTSPSACEAPAGEPLLCEGWARTAAASNWRPYSIVVSNASAPLGWRYTRYLRVRGLFSYEWDETDEAVASIEAGNRTLSLAPPFSGNGYWGGTRYYAYGAPEALDVPGEYFVDEDRGVLYVLPPPAMAMAAISVAAEAEAVAVSEAEASTPASRRQTGERARTAARAWRAVGAGAGATLAAEVSFGDSLLTIANSSGVAVTDVALDGARAIAVTIANSSDVTMARIHVNATGTGGIHAHDALNRRVTIANSTIRDTGEWGVWLSGGNRTTLDPGDSLVTDNTILRFGRRCLTYTPAVSVDGVGNVVQHNALTSGPHCGAMFSGNSNLIQFNVISDVMRATWDVGAVCTGPRDWTQAGNLIRYNFLHGNGATAVPCNRFTDPLRTGVYADVGNFGITVYGNVIWHPTPTFPQLNATRPPRYFAVYNHGGRNMPIVNNIAVDTNFTANAAIGLEGDKGQETNGSSYYTNLRTLHWRDPPYSTAYPGLALLDDFYSPHCADVVTCGPAPWNNSAAVNVVVNASVLFEPADPAAGFPLSRFNITRNLRVPAGGDPGWVSKDPRSDLDFRLRADSPAYGPAVRFARIPMAQFGPRHSWRDDDDGDGDDL